MEIGSYTIPTPNLWLIGLGRIVYGDASSLKESTRFPALDACRIAVDGNATPATTQSQALDLTAQGEAWRQKYLFRMDELTNSLLGDDSSGTTRYYSRDISTFLGEWGRLAVYDLSSIGTFSWAAELAMFFDDGTTPTNGFQYVVGTSGAIEKASPNNDRMYTRCRG